MKPVKPFESIAYNGKTIVIVDVSNTKFEEAIPVLQEAQEQIALLPRNSVLVLTDARNAIFNAESAKAMKDFASKNTPYVKASAVLGADGFRAVLLQAVRMLTQRDIKAFKNREEALSWLASRR
jgi:hypothetical protein